MQVQANGETGHTVIASSTVFNNRGLVDKQYVSQDYASILTSYQAPDVTWKYTSYTYDALGRVVTQTGADGTTISHDFSVAWQDLVTSPGLTPSTPHKKRYFYDAFQRLIQVDELYDNGDLYATTIYEYDVLGNLIHQIST